MSNFFNSDIQKEMLDNGLRKNQFIVQQKKKVKIFNRF